MDTITLKRLVFTFFNVFPFLFQVRINDSDMKILLAKQQQLQQQQQGGAPGGGAGSSGTKTHVQIPAGAQGAANIAQLLAQGGNIQVHSGAGGTQVATIVKTATSSASGGATQVVAAGPQTQSVTIPVSAAASMTMPQVRAALARNPAQMQFIQRQILQRSPASAGQVRAATGQTVNAANLTQQQKIALSQAAGKGMPQLIVSSGGNAGAANAVPAGAVGQKVGQTGVTVHQFQQLVKQGNQSGAPAAVQQISGPIPHAVLAKQQTAAGAVQARVIPVSSGGSQVTGAVTARPGQQIQVVAAAPGQAVAAAVAAAARQGGAAAPNVTVDASGRPAGAAAGQNSHLANALASQIRIQGGQQQQLMSAIVQGQPVSVAVRGPAAASLLAAQQQGQKLQVVGATGPAAVAAAASAAVSTASSSAQSTPAAETASTTASAASTQSTAGSNANPDAAKV